MVKDVKYLIIGNGIAGLSAAKAIRNNDKEASLTIVSNEPYLSYYRLKLTRELSNYDEDDKIFVNDKSWYGKNNIELVLEKNVSKILESENMIELEDGNTITYEKLLIATGSSPFLPPIKGSEKEGVFTLRNINNLKSIRNYIKDIDKITVIGGGLLGIEAAWSLKLLGKKVSLIEFGPYLLNRQLDEELGTKLKNRLEEEGMDIYLPKAAEEILGQDRVEKIILSNGDVVEADAVLISSGTRPNLKLVEDSKIKYDRGIIVDENLKTNVDNIYAAGDVAEYAGMVHGLWTASNLQGRVAGNNMSGNVEAYSNPSTFTNLRVGDIQIFSVGDVLDYEKVYEYKEDDSHHKLFVKDNRLSGAILSGDLSQQNSLRNAVINRMTLDDYLVEGIKFS